METIVNENPINTAFSPSDVSLSSQWPTNSSNKPKKKRVVGIVLAFLLIVVVSVATFYVSTKLNTAQTPNAPSKSKASESCSPKFYLNKTTNACDATTNTYTESLNDCSTGVSCASNLATFVDANNRPTGGVCYDSKTTCEVANSLVECKEKFFVDKNTNSCLATTGLYSANQMFCGPVPGTCSDNLKLYRDDKGLPTGGTCFNNLDECKASITTTSVDTTTTKPGCSQKYFLDMNSGTCMATSHPNGYDSNQIGCNEAAESCSDNLTWYLGGAGIRTGGVCFDTKSACEATATNGAKPGTGDNTFTCTETDANAHPVCQNKKEVNASWLDGTCIFMICPEGDTNGDGSCGVQDTGYKVKGAGNCFSDILVRAHRLPPEMCYQVDAVVSATDNRYCELNQTMGAPCFGYEANMNNCAGKVTSACTDTTWTPAVNTVCTGTNLTQTSNCGKTRSVAGTKTDGTCSPTATITPACVDTTWTPAVNTVCTGTNLTQTSNCGTTRTVDGTKVCGEPDLSMIKKAYFDESSNTAGNYKLSTEIDTISKEQVFVYAFVVTNIGNAKATEITVSDTLKGENQELLTLIDADSRCKYVSSTRKVTCSGMSLDPDKTDKYSFRVKVSASAVNGETIKNVALLDYKEMPADGEIEASLELNISTVVGCNNACTSDDECVSGLSCDVDTNKCRRPSCSDASSCNCPKTLPDPTEAPIRRATQRTAQPTVLPETGILDFPGVAAFGGGLLLAIVGILLAL